MCQIVARTFAHPGTGSATYCSGVSLRQASSILSLAQRLKANRDAKSSFTIHLLSSELCTQSPQPFEHLRPSRLSLTSVLGPHRRWLVVRFDSTASITCWIRSQTNGVLDRKEPAMSQVQK